MKRILKIMLATFVAVFCVNFFCTYVEAAVNSEYKNITVEDSTGDDVEEEVTNATLGDKIMQYVGRFIFSVAKLIELAITTFSQWVFGVDEFPWEDYIVFNSLPYLDINFFNPANGSIFTVGEDSGMSVGDMVRNVYFSLLTLSLSILGIGVAVTAIRLAVSSIASEKAKYKEAITKCLYTVIMLFSVHILISFVFYLNETIVSACSQMLKSLVTEQQLAKLQEAIDNQDTSKNYSFLTANAWPYDSTVSISNNGLLSTIKKGGYIVVQGWSWADDVTGEAIADAINGAFGTNLEYFSLEELDYYECLARYEVITSTDAGAAIFSYLINQSGYLTARAYDGTVVSSDGTFSGDSSHVGKAVYTIKRVLFDCEAILNTSNIDDLSSYWENNKDTNGSSWKAIEDSGTSTSKQDWYSYVEAAYKKFKLDESDEEAIANIISSLGEEFKAQAQNIVDSVEINYIPLILYCILLLQSIMLLINYIKRVFYVTLLALLAPIVVIYDFFISAI